MLQRRDAKLWEVDLQENTVIVVHKAKTKHPPNGAVMWSRGFLGSPTACLRRESTIFQEDNSVPVVRCRPFCVDSLTATPFIVELDVDGIRGAKDLNYADAYVNNSHISIIEFLDAPRFDSRFGSQAGNPSGGWNEIFSAEVHRPDRNVDGVIAFPVVPPSGWVDGRYYHVVLVAGGPFDELRGVCFAFKVRLTTYKKTAESRPFLMTRFLHQSSTATIDIPSQKIKKQKTSSSS